MDSPEASYLTFEELTAQALIDQGMQLTHEMRSTWIREKFCTVAGLGRIAYLINQQKECS